MQEAGLSNQAFYRHFASKDALLLAVLADGQRQLVGVPRAGGSRSASDPTEQVQRWISGVMAQARDRDAAEATRPFACNSARLADLFPADLAASRAEMLDVAHARGARARRHRRTRPSSSATSRSRA